MAVDIGKAFIGVYADMGPFEAGLAAGTREVSKSAKVKAATRGLGAAMLGSVAVVAKKGISEAIDISESLNKNEVLFKKFSKKVDQFSKDSAASLGISRSAALEATGTYGNLFRALELGPKKAANMSVALTKLAADLASFNNASPEEALEAIRSGLVGETEPLRKFGVNMNDATLRQEALRQGLVNNTKEALEPQTKALAAYGLIFQQTKQAQGDFGRTSEGLANQQRILKAEFSDISASVGVVLLPLLSKLATVVGDVATFFQQHETAAKVFAGGLAAVGAALLIITGGPVTLTVAAIAGLVAGFVEAYRHSESFRKVVDAVGAALQSAFKAALPWIANAFHNVTEALKDAGKWMSTAFKNIKGTIGTVIKSLKEFWHQSAIVRAAVAVLVGVFKVWAAVIKTVLIATFNQFLGVVKRVIASVIQIFKGFKQVITGIVQVISGILTLRFGRAWKGIQNIFSGGIKVALGLLRGMTAPARQIIATIGDKISDAFSSVWDKISGVFEDGVNKVGGFMQTLADFINPVLGAIGVGEIHIQSGSDVPLVKSRYDLHHGKTPKKAKGGPVRVPGRGHQDNVPLSVNGRLSAVVAPGEDLMVTNRHQRPLLDAAVAAAYGVNGLPGFFNTYNRPHYASSGGYLPHYASGVLGVLEDVGNVVTAPVRLPAEAGIDLFNTAKNAAQFIAGLPDLPDSLHGIFGEVAQGVLNKIKDWITSVPDAIFGGDDPQGDLKGKVSWFNGGATAGGRNTSEPGIAVNLHPGTEGGWNNKTTQHWMEMSNAGHPKYANVTIGGHSAKLPITDLGPAGFTNRAIDVTEGGVRKLGFSLAGFPTDAEGVAEFLARGGLVGRNAQKAKEQGNPFNRIVMAGASSAAPGGKRGFKPRTIGRIKSKADSIASAFTGYVWGGGHSEGTHVTANGLDCSGAVAKLLQQSGWTDFAVAHSSEYAHRFHPGEGDLFTIWSNNDHTFVDIEGQQWGTYDDSLGYHSHSHSGFAASHPILASEPGSGSGSTKENTAHSFKEDVPAVYHGARTDSLSFGAVPKSLKGIEKEIRERSAEKRLYIKASAIAEKKKRPAIKHAIDLNITKLDSRLHELSIARRKAKEEIAKSRFSRKLTSRLAKLFGFEDEIGAKERQYNALSQTAEQLVALEPVAPDLPAKATNKERIAAEEAYVAQYRAYVEGREKPAFSALLGIAGSWRNTILRGETMAAGDWQSGKKLGGLEGSFEDQIIALGHEISHIEGLRGEHNAKWWKNHPKARQHLMKQLARLPMLKYKERELRKSLGEARSVFYPGKARVTDPNPPYAGSGSLEDALTNVQGVHWPDQHEILGALPGFREAGKFGGIIWDIQSSLEELGMKIPTVQTEEEEGSGSSLETERNELLAPLLEEEVAKLRRELTVKRIDEDVLSQFGVKQYPFMGTFHDGGIVPGRQGEEGLALVEAGEMISQPGDYIPHVSIGVNDSKLAEILEISVEKKLRKEASNERRSRR